MTAIRRALGIMLCAVLLLAAAGGASRAQSVFGINFIGQHIDGADARNSGLGCSGLALSDTSSSLPANRASLARLGSVTLSLYEVISLSRVNTELESSDQNRFMLPSAHLSVPLTDGLVFAFGYRTRFSGRGDMTYEKEVDFTPVPKELYESNLSLYSVPFSLSWAPADWLSVAGEVQVERGSIKDEVYVYFDDPSYSSMSSIRTRAFSGTSWGLSALLRVHPRVTLGAVFDDRIDYSVEETRKYSLSRLDTLFTYDFTLPRAWGAGVAVGLTPRWWASSSFWMRKAPDPEGFEQLKGGLSDETVISFGLERRGSDEGGRLSRMPLRFGYYEDRWHLEFPAGEQVVSRFFTVGSGFGMPGGPGRLDVTLEFGKTGSVSTNLIDEKTVRLGMSLSFSEKWLRREKERH